MLEARNDGTDQVIDKAIYREGNKGPNVLPEDGTQVSAKTFPSIEYDRDAEEVTGTLETRPSPFGGMPQCWVNGTQVDPRTVKADESDTTDEETGVDVPDAYL